MDDFEARLEETRAKLRADGHSLRLWRETREAGEACRKCGAKTTEYCRHSSKPNKNSGSLIGQSMTDYVIENRKSGDFMKALGLK